MIEFEIYFNDLNENVQKRLLAELNISSAKDMNWDIFPLATIDFETEIDDEERN